MRKLPVLLLAMGLAACGATHAERPVAASRAADARDASAALVPCRAAVLAQPRNADLAGRLPVDGRPTPAQTEDRTLVAPGDRRRVADLLDDLARCAAPHAASAPRHPPGEGAAPDDTARARGELRARLIDGRLSWGRYHRADLMVVHAGRRAPRAEEGSGGARPRAGHATEAQGHTALGTAAAATPRAAYRPVAAAPHRP